MIPVLFTPSQSSTIFRKGFKKKFIIVPILLTPLNHNSQRHFQIGPTTFITPTFFPVKKVSPSVPTHPHPHPHPFFFYPESWKQFLPACPYPSCVTSGLCFIFVSSTSSASLFILLSVSCRVSPCTSSEENSLEKDGNGMEKREGMRER